MVLALAFPLLPHDAVALDLAWVVIVFPAALVVAVRCRYSGKVNMVCDHLGRLSYVVYILHAPLILFLTGMIKVALGEAWDDHLGLLAAGLIAATLGMASVSTYLFDEPLRRRLRVRRGPAGPMGTATEAKG